MLASITRNARLFRRTEFSVRCMSSAPVGRNGGVPLPACEYTPKPYTGPSFEEVKAMRSEYLSPSLFAYYQKPIMTVEGKKQWLFDDKGNRYLDLYGGIVTVSVGHCHPEVNKAAKEQMDLLQHTTNIYYNPQIALYAKELAAKLPPHLRCLYFVNSGSEANDMALLLARAHTKSTDIISLRNGYHGMSYTTMGVTALSSWRHPVIQMPGIQHAKCPDLYRGAYADLVPEEQQADMYANDVQDIIRYSSNGQVAGFLHESIQGIGGAVTFPDGYLKKAYAHVKKAGGVCIADEVQTGFGRTGTNFWGFENHGIQPDIVTMAKGIGNGAALGCVATSKEIAGVMSQRLHFNTYGGNPISTAIGRAVLRTVEDEGLQQNSLVLGKKFKEGFKKLAEKHKIIGDVRGEGLMLGVELVKDRKTKEPATEEFTQLFERTKDMGLLLGKGGFFGNVFRIKPPMCITEEDVDFTLKTVDIAMSEL
eukprot:TRINITY_DN17270_c0_g1_i1.p1 TRINITY_DN17270_c0_g1~~TRINITY_DN17270_c0_g1_i1.p1  ORF type:complete len:478 (+),score=141.23 TRINITY_DN17270_c0_g1_i1:124-1557(+)